LPLAPLFVPPTTTHPTTFAPILALTNLPHHTHTPPFTQVDWAELFSDLVLVAVALQMSSAVKYDFSWETLATVSTSYLLVFSSWTHMAAFVSRFPQSHLV
jgi:low temperature requirement protein LtrA